MAGMPVGPAVSMNLPPDDHYLTHLPKHLGCRACMNCKVQRKHCRDHNKRRQRKLVEITKTPAVDAKIEDFEKMDDPKTFGDLVTSDSVFAIKRNSTNAARVNETTTLVVRDKATSWIATTQPRGNPPRTSWKLSTTSKARKRLSAGTQTEHLSYIACAASSEFGTTSPTPTVLRQTVSLNAPIAPS